MSSEPQLGPGANAKMWINKIGTPHGDPGGAEQRGVYKPNFIAIQPDNA